jgi:DNA-binding NtrC family response regulator
MTERPTPLALHVLVVDDEESMRFFVKSALKRAGHQVSTASNGTEALGVLDQSLVDVVVTDLRMPAMDGHELFREILKLKAPPRVVLMTGFGSIKDAVSALASGAENYLTKPFEAEELLLAVERAGEKARLELDAAAWKASAADGAFEGLAGRADVMRELARTIARVAPRRGPVLICGESGTGKELVARAVHKRSERSGPFVAVHAAGFPQGLLETELFGVEAGAFTGADQSRAGYIERASNGTLYLDEVGEIPIEAQPSLLRFLQEGEVVRVGGTEVLRPDVRVVASSTHPLRELVQRGRLRQDLFFRLNVLPIEVPPLRDRLSDMPLLVQAILTRLGRGGTVVTPAALALLCARPWPGNVRELANTIERSLVLKPEGPLDAGDFHFDEATSLPEGGERSYREVLEDFERRFLESILLSTAGNLAEAARQIRLPRPTLHARVVALGIDLQRFRTRGGDS